LAPSVRNKVRPSLLAADDELLLTTTLEALELASLLAALLPPPDEPPPQATKPKILILEITLSAPSLSPRLGCWLLCMEELRCFVISRYRLNGFYCGIAVL
jgi:hypothetical protein